MMLVHSEKSKIVTEVDAGKMRAEIWATQGVTEIAKAEEKEKYSG